MGSVVHIYIQVAGDETRACVCMYVYNICMFVCYVFVLKLYIL